MFLEISQNSQENTCARVSFLIKLPFSQNTSRRLLLNVCEWLLLNDFDVTGSTIFLVWECCLQFSENVLYGILIRDSFCHKIIIISHTKNVHYNMRAKTSILICGLKVSWYGRKKKSYPLHENIRAFGLVIINSILPLSSWTIKYSLSP